MNIYRKTKGENTRRISVGDVVLIKDNELSVRTQWRMGKVLELVKGRDGQIREAKLKVLSKKGKQTAVFRPFQRLIPFEINENHDYTSKQQPKESKYTQPETRKSEQTCNRSVKSCCQQADIWMRSLALYLSVLTSPQRPVNRSVRSCCDRAAAMLFSTGLLEAVVTELQQCCFQQACRK
jgi:hypothetical protein